MKVHLQTVNDPFLLWRNDPFLLWRSGPHSLQARRTLRNGGFRYLQVANPMALVRR